MPALEHTPCQYLRLVYTNTQGYCKVFLHKCSSSISLDHGVALWKAYNFRLLEVCESEDIPILSFDQLAADDVAATQALIESSGLSQAAKGLGLFDNMQREAAATLYGLCPALQQEVTANDYEIIAIDNGSTHPLDPDEVAAIAPNISYHFQNTNSVSPVGAVNLGADMAQNDALAVIVDGARMATPGLVRQSLAALHLNKQAFVCALFRHPGPDV